MSFLLDSLIKKIKQDTSRKRPLIMTHVVLGYPSLSESCELAMAMIDGGASIVELQIPFSDPLADGPTIMRANEHAIAQGVTPHKCMRAMEKLARRTDTPLLFMSYFNILYNFEHRQNGAVKEFLKSAANAGAQGIIVPDIPVEEDKNESYWTAAENYKIRPIPLVSPLTSSARLSKLSPFATSFVYCVSTTGTTGSRKSLPADIGSYLKRVKTKISAPRAVGFGISSPQHIRALSAHAEIAIVGSATIDLISKTPPKKRGIDVRKEVRKFIERLRSA